MGLQCDVRDRSFAVDQFVEIRGHAVGENLLRYRFFRTGQNQVVVWQGFADHAGFIPALESAQQDVIHLQTDRHRVRRDLVVFETEDGIFPVEYGVDGLFRFCDQHVGEFVLGQYLHFNQQTSQMFVFGFLSFQSFPKLGFVDLSSREEEVTKQVGRLVGRASDHIPFEEEDGFYDSLILDLQSSGLPGTTQPLQQIDERHRRKPADQRHGALLLGKPAWLSHWES